MLSTISRLFLKRHIEKFIELLSVIDTSILETYIRSERRLRVSNGHDQLCRNLRALLDRFCPGPKPPTARIIFGKPEPKTVYDEILVDLDQIVRAFQSPSTRRVRRQEGHTMAQFETTINNTQKILATVVLTDPAGNDVAVQGLNLSATGDGTFSKLASDGTDLPPNQFYCISGPTVSDTTYSVDAMWSATLPPINSIVIMHVTEGTPSAVVNFGTAEPK